MIVKILAGVAALIALFIVIVALQPADFRYSRSAVMKAPAPIVFAHVNDFRLWSAWSPWAKLDPDAKNTFEGPATGVDSKMSWAGNKNVGEGHMTIVESVPGEKIKMRLDFIKPMTATHTAEWTFQPQEDGQTLVTWSMYGQNNFIGKAMGLVMNCEKMMNGYFDEGLANLKSITEAQAAAE